MTLKIDRAQSQIRLSGKFGTEHLDQVAAEIEVCESPVILDLEEVDLADVEAIRFLNACEAKGILILNCSPYIRTWMLRERNQPEKHTKKRKKEK